MLTGMRWLSGRIAFLTTVTALVVLHLVAVTFAAIPPNRFSDSVAPSTGYLEPYFAQNWRLFAPNPVAQDRTVRFQIAYRDDAGDVQNSDWIDWTAVELDLVRHRIVGGRAGYITNKMIGSLSSRYNGLNGEQRSIANIPTDENPLSWEQLESQLADAGVTPNRLNSFLLYERSIVRLGSDIAAGRYPDSEVVAVRYGIALQGVTPYAERGGTEAERQAARPNRTERLSGWRTPLAGSEAEREAVASFDTRHR